MVRPVNHLRIMLTLLLGAFAGGVIADQTRQTLQHDGETRGYELYVPSSYTGNTRAPLLLVLHGRSGNGQRMADLTRFNARAERHGFLVLYPDGLQGQWNYLHDIPGAAAGTDDVGFLLDLVDRVASAYHVDRRKLFVTGLSNGGFMAQRLACVAENRFAAFASVAASGFAAMPDSCGGHASIDALYLHGTADSLVPWEGLGVRDTRGNQQQVTLSLTDSLKFWAGYNHCNSNVGVEEVPTTGRSPGTRVKILSAQGCYNNAEVVLYAIIDGGHNWPGVADFIPQSVAGQVNLDIHASDVIWSFFARKRHH